MPVVSVKPDDTLGKAVGKVLHSLLESLGMRAAMCCRWQLAATGMHRVFVVDSKQRPVGVVSIGDILTKVVSAPPAEDKGDSKAEVKGEPIKTIKVSTSS